jgi:hypothetical protein
MSRELGSPRPNEGEGLGGEGDTSLPNSALDEELRMRARTPAVC